MSSWLDKAPTVLINLGSSVTYDEYLAIEMAKAIKALLATTEVQVLWKCNKRTRTVFSDGFLTDLEGEIKEGRMRLEKWIKPDPAALLGPEILCSQSIMVEPIVIMKQLGMSASNLSNLTISRLHADKL